MSVHTIDREEEESTNSLFNKRNRGIVHITVKSCTETLPLSPTHPPPHVNYEVMLTCLDIGVSVGPIENGQLHQLHFLQVVLPLSL